MEVEENAIIEEVDLLVVLLSFLSCFLIYLDAVILEVYGMSQGFAFIRGICNSSHPKIPFFCSTLRSIK